MKFVASLFAVLITLIFASSASYGAAYSGPSQPAAQGTEFVSVGEFGGFSSLSSRGVVANAEGSGKFDGWVCPEGLGEGSCDLMNPDYRFGGASLLPVCESDSQENCIEELAFSVQGSEYETATFIREVGTEKQLAIPDQNLYYGGGVSLFSGPANENAGGAKTYGVSAAMSIAFDRKTKKFYTDAIDLGVYPYSLLTGNYVPPKTVITTRPDGSSQSAIHGSGDCIWSDLGECGVLEEFPAELRIRLSLRIASEVTGWFRGRLARPVVEFEKFSQTNNRITIDAEPVQVARMLAVATSENTTAKEQAIMLVTGGSPTPTLFAGAHRYPFSHWGDFAWVEMFRDIANDTAYETSTIWTLGTISGASNNKCLAETGRVLGLVTTNATMYNGVVPDFINGELTYKVSGLHYAPDGETLNLGTYDLVMRSDVARCLYGFSRAPISAKVQVLAANGDETIATTIVREEDGWLRLAAYGFTFSEKEIKARITQPQNKTLTKFAGRSISLTSKQMAEVKSLITKAKGNSKFICTGVYLKAADKTAAIKRARASCNYAKSLDPNFSFYSQAKVTKAASYAGKVMVTSK